LRVEPLTAPGAAFFPWRTALWAASRSRGQAAFGGLYSHRSGAVRADRRFFGHDGSTHDCRFGSEYPAERVRRKCRRPVLTEALARSPASFCHRPSCLSGLGRIAKTPPRLDYRGLFPSTCRSG
jgi:hypothetical protein